MQPGQRGGDLDQSTAFSLTLLPRALGISPLRMHLLLAQPCPDTSPERPPQTLTSCVYAPCSHKDTCFSTVLRLTFRGRFYILSREKFLEMCRTRKNP